MIDVENIVFNTVAEAVRTEFPGIYMAGDSSITPSSFPCVYCEEIDNYTLIRTLDTSGVEQHARIAYEFNVFSNLQTGRKSQCKKIVSIIDNIMFGLGFLRIGKQPNGTPNADPSIYRMVVRYRATVGKNKTVFRN